ncbi:hypothetical protein AVEN_51279-1 [Araneus ventricosus]|uniref:Retrovirus-related Pol polyprotein from transposon TNT 1-94-like beta-barrel domain-containing protein n=1 Tax=Araneus ventricosus TaxID=182803 RepID=A0A4Y2ND92_ARAVE|nr:hypothetical protein AVEN_51279-1 [Araneus ventricosus]
MDAELKYCVDQFDVANFAVWARRIESIFVAKNLDKCLSIEADETKKKFRQGHIARFGNKTVVCHHCGKLGRKKRNCRNLTLKKSSFKEEATVPFVVGEGEVKKFIVDSGDTSHICSQREWFEELKPSPGTVSCAAKSSFLEVTGKGLTRGRLKNIQEIVLTNVLFIPGLNGNLISVKQIQKAEYSVLFKDNKAIVKRKNKTFVLCELNSKEQYISDFIPTVSNIFVVETEEAELLHRRLRHSGNHALRKLGLPSDSFCENCVLAKQSTEPIGKGTAEGKVPLCE